MVGGCTMKQLLPDSKMPFNQKCLLFCLEKKMIENDLIYSEQHEERDTYTHKDIWFSVWKLAVNKVLSESATDNPLLLDSFDSSMLYNALKGQHGKSKPKWEKILYKQCMNFSPYNWEDLEATGKCDGETFYKQVSPILKINARIKNKTLSEIANFLNYYKNKKYRVAV